MDLNILTKSEQRKYFIDKRNAVLDMELKSEIICRNFCESNIYNKINTVMVYVSFRSEVQTISLIRKLIRDKHRVIVPKCDVKNKHMTLYAISDFSQLSNGAYNILEPNIDLIENGEIPKCNKSDIDAVITPAVAFDKYGFRLGYGAGYYDRFFKDYNGIKIGFQFSDCICDRLSVEEEDIPVDIIYSDLGCMIINDSCRL